MKVSIGIPSADAISKYLDYSAKASFSYEEVGESKNARVQGYDNDHSSKVVGKGTEDWEKAKQILLNWDHFPAAWTKIHDLNPTVEVGNDVAVTFNLFGLWWVNSARIVYFFDEPNRFGFAYGTLHGHVETGEEIFYLEKDSEGIISYHLKAFSKPAYWFVRLGYPAARFFQRKFVRDSLNQVKKLVNSSSINELEMA